MTTIKPLAGVRIIDLTVVWAGTFGATLLADLGAEVIKVENIHVWQPMTRGAVARPSAASIAAGAGWGTGYPNGVPGERPWNHPPTFVQMFRNKYSVTIDLLGEGGREVFGRLVERSDALIENNAVGTLEKLGIGPDFLRSYREDLIALRMPAYGETGPYREARALGVHLESVMGHTLLRGYPDLDPSYITSIFSGDYVAGAHGAFAIMAALRHRRRTGEGQFIEMAQAECAGGMLAQALMDYSLNGRVQERVGNGSLEDDVPHGVYPAHSAGDASDGGDRWISIAVMNDEQWLGLRAAIGGPEWAMGGRAGDDRGPARGSRDDRRAARGVDIAARRLRDVPPAAIARRARGAGARELTRARRRARAGARAERGADPGRRRWPVPLQSALLSLLGDAARHLQAARGAGRGQ